NGPGEPRAAVPPQTVDEAVQKSSRMHVVVDDLRGEHKSVTCFEHLLAENKIVCQIVCESSEPPDVLQTAGTYRHGWTEGESHALQTLGNHHSGHEFSAHAQSF